MVMAGFLPFSAIYIELYYIFASIWGHKVYTIYSILFIVFLILIVVTAFITVALTYFQLAVEDHRWWWRSFLCGGSTAFFVLGYCFFYYHYRQVMCASTYTALPVEQTAQKAAQDIRLAPSHMAIPNWVLLCTQHRSHG